MRRLWIAIAALALAGSAQASDHDRITASPTLPKTAGEKQPGGEEALSATPELAVGQTIYSTEGTASAQIVEVVRDKEGKPTRVILATRDGVHRYTPVADLSRVRGRLQADLSRAQILALPRIEAE